MSASTAALLLVLSPAPVPAVIASAEAAPVVEATQGEPPAVDAQGAPPSTPLPQQGTIVFPALPADPALPQPQTPTAEAASPEASGGEIVVTAREEVPGDPLAEVNAQSYEVVQELDKAFVAPIALTYEKIVPDPLRDGLRNFLRNLEEPVIAFNYLLQLKPGRAAKSVARFAVNSTIGIAGLIDVAKKEPFNLPYTPNGFANTFACYGIGPGSYLYLPLVGSTTVRDLIGVTLDRAAFPAVAGAPFNQPEYALPASTIDALNDRIEVDGQLQKIRDESGDPYAASRELYLKQREAEIAAICPKKGEIIDETLPPRAGKGKD
jgi:phospholipid-binding lipoprotein MlaA